MAALMNVLREEIATTVASSTGALSTVPSSTTATTMSRTIMNTVRQEVATTASTTTESSILKEITGGTNGSSLLSATQIQTAASPRELVSNAMQQGLESLGDSVMEGGLSKN